MHIETQVRVTGEDVNIPLDARIEVDRIAEGTADYSDIMAKLPITEGQMYDISLYTETKIKENNISTGDFTVSIPIDEN